MTVTLARVMVAAPFTAVRNELTSTDEHVTWGGMAVLTTMPEAKVSVNFVIASAFTEELFVMVIVRVVACPARIGLLLLVPTASD